MAQPNENPQQTQETVMYVLINTDPSCKMDKGKTAGQACHSACKVIQVLERNNPTSPDYVHWCNNSYPKIVLKATLDQINQLIQLYSDTNNPIWCVHTRDLGKTQIPAGILTSLAFCPMLKSNTPTLIKSLKLL